MSSGVSRERQCVYVREEDLSCPPLFTVEPHCTILRVYTFRHSSYIVGVMALAHTVESRNFRPHVMSLWQQFVCAGLCRRQGHLPGVPRD